MQIVTEKFGACGGKLQLQGSSRIKVVFCRKLNNLASMTSGLLYINHVAAHACKYHKKLQPLLLFSG
jgi:hypothetical protein